jgi:hypothetical protein
MRKVITYTISGERFETTMDAADLAALETMAKTNSALKITDSRSLKVRRRTR